MNSQTLAHIAVELRKARPWVETDTWDKFILEGMSLLGQCNDALNARIAAKSSLSVRAKKALERLGVDPDNPLDVAKVSHADLRDTRNCGETSINEIKAWLADHGLHFNFKD